METSAIVLVLLFAAASPSYAASAQTCELLANQGDCSFYRECVEKRIPGENLALGYALKYGEKYCNRFTENLDCFNSKGQSWVIGVRSCLMKAILSSDVYQNNGTNQELLEFGFASHAKCYVDHGFCSAILPSITENLYCLFTDVYEAKDFFSIKSLNQVYETLEYCFGDYADQFLNKVINTLKSVTGVFKDFLKSVKDFFDDCETGVDLLIAMDSSGSVKLHNFETAKSFVVDLISLFQIGSDATRVGIITFSSDVHNRIPLGSILDSSALKNATQNIPYSDGGTRTDLALDFIVDVFEENNRIDNGIPRIAIIITDGQSNEPELTVLAAARVHDENIQVYSFGVGPNVDDIELNTIASESTAVYHIDSFAPESFAAELKPLQSAACKTPAIIDISQTVSNTIGQEEVQYTEMNFPINEGITIDMDITVGELTLHGSFSIQNPTSLTSDFSATGSAEENDGTFQYFVSPDLYHESVYSELSDEVTKRQTIESVLYIALIGVEAVNNFTLNSTFGNSIPVIIPTTSPQPTSTGTPQSPTTTDAAACNLSMSCLIIVYISVIISQLLLKVF